MGKSIFAMKSKGEIEMDFADEIKQFASRVKDTISTEEATKMSVIVPFFQLLGYDVFNPNEFTPEYVADVGIKKGEKVDYAIMEDGKPLILIECKAISEQLDKHASQLFRYFGTSEAKFGILTNGIIYKFYTDLEETNKMDLVPFLEFNILEMKSSSIRELKKFKKEQFDVETIFTNASKLRYSRAIKEIFNKQLEQPDDDFVRFFLQYIYDGAKTQNIIDKYRDLIKTALNDTISERMTDKITSALNVNEVTEQVEEPEIDDKKSKIITTEEEIQSFYIIKGFFAGVCELSRIAHRDTESYFGILLDDNNRKPICRLNLDAKKKHIMIPDKDKKFERFYIDSLDDLYKYRQQLVEVIKMYE